jgi:phage repressor protein C with HTH and peptisase S24 domain
MPNSRTNTVTTGERVKMRRQELHMSQDKLATLAGLTQPTISALEKNRANTSGSLASIASALGVSALWLETGLGEMVPPGTVQGVSANDDAYIVPLLDARGSCGNGRMYGDIDTTPITISKRLLGRCRASFNFASMLAALYADGDSMAPYITHGDIILFDSGVTDFQDGGIYVLDTPDGLRIKRVHRRADGRVILRSDSQDKTRYPDEDYTPDQAESLVVKGKYVMRLGC